MSGRDLPCGISIRKALIENDALGVYFRIERNGHCLAFSLPEDEALSVALAILGVSIEIRDEVSHRWRPRLIESGGP